MTDKNIYEIIEQLSPTEIQRQRVWESLTDNNKITKPRRKILLIAAIILIITIVSCFGIAAVTRVIFIPKGEISFYNEEITANTALLYSADVEIYAPEIIHIDKNKLIFETPVGILVYDRPRKKVIQTINLHKLGAYYIDHGSDFGDPPQYKTHTYVEDDSIIIFNTEKTYFDTRKPYGSAYKYEIANNNSTQIAVEETNDNNTIAEYYKRWKKAQKNRTDTFDRYFDYLILEGYSGEGMYSYTSIKWSCGNKTYNSFLTVDEQNQYQLRNADTSGFDIECERLEIASKEEIREYKKANKLPEFRYSGDDEAIKAICEYDTTQYDTADYENSVWIPAYKECGRVRDGDELLVFGDFWYFIYVKNGDVLECVSGGEIPACYHLKKTSDGYKVTDVEHVADGGLYLDSLAEICEGHPMIYAKMLNNKGGTMKYMKMYLQDNNLNLSFRDEFTDKIVTPQN